MLGMECAVALANVVHQLSPENAAVYGVKCPLEAYSGGTVSNRASTQNGMTVSRKHTVSRLVPCLP